MFVYKRKLFNDSKTIMFKFYRLKFCLPFYG